MLKDLLESLKQSAAQTEARRNLGEQSLAAAMAPSPVGNKQRTGRGRRNSGGKGPNLGSTGNAKLDAFLEAVSTQESGGNYSAVGVPTKYGTARGKYQILDSNLQGPGGWDEEVLGRNISIKQFMNRPKLQEKIARGKLSDYFNQYGAEGAAKAWYAGPGNANTDSDSPQYGGPSINDYAASVLKHMMGYMR